MLDILLANEDAVPSINTDESKLSIEALSKVRDRPERGPIFSVESLMEGRSPYDAVFEDATPIRHGR